MNSRGSGCFGHAPQPLKVINQSGEELTCFKCHAIGHVAKICPQCGSAQQTGNQVNSQASRTLPSKVRRCYRCQSTQHLIRFCLKASKSGENGDQVRDAQVRGSFQPKARNVHTALITHNMPVLNLMQHTQRNQRKYRKRANAST